MDLKIFHDKSWSTIWHPAGDPPNDTESERSIRQRPLPDWSDGPQFLKFQSFQPGGWPWGFAIYRTSYAKTCDEDWARAIEKFDEACLADLGDSERWWFQSGKSHIYEARQGYRNVIFEDPALEGASEVVIRNRHRKWVEGHGLPVLHSSPRIMYCLLFDDRCIRSILASTLPKKSSPLAHQLERPHHGRDPDGMVGYVNLIDAEFDPEDPENECGPCYHGLVRLHLDCLFKFANSCEDLMAHREWDGYVMENPTQVIYIDGPHSTIESKEMFLSSTARFLGEGESVTEAQYIEAQR
ncbi:hypothetical protein N7457_002576 [Penicillium paradoxum]|uniref:uncharacterized protein n=1 Tax=Penicillium paradoxum TaxID=176176 RepID=UPI0025492FEF|nr:uncharacterized protein N7457_002576 [Penicillium paradoxum]KAJ5787586.1 hypothetical protein N7457_002576 [Penicillium paradoxum]